MEFKGLSVSARQLGTVLDLTDRRIRQLAEEGVFTRNGRGQYPLIDCVQAYIATVADGTETDDLRQERISLMKAQRRRIELDNDDREATEHDLDFQLSVVGVLVCYWQLEHRCIAGWLHDELNKRGYREDARIVAGTVENWLISLRAKIESDLNKAVDAARSKKIVIKDMATLSRLLGKGRDPHANDYHDAAEPPRRSKTKEHAS
jgi:hypothetical protein